MKKEILIQIAIITSIILVIAIISHHIDIKKFRLASIDFRQKCSKTQIMDIDKVDVGYNKKGFKRYIHITARTGSGGGDCVRIAWTKKQLNDALENSPDTKTRKYKAKKDLPVMYITLDKAERRFSINKQSTLSDINKLRALKRGGFCKSFGYCTITQCKSEGYPNTIYAVRLDDKEECGMFQFKCACIEPYIYITPGYWGVKIEDYRKVTFGIEGLGEETTEGVGSIPSINLKGKAFVEWDGDLFSGIWVNPPTQYIPIRKEGRWYFESKNRYDTYDDNYDLSIECIKECSGRNDCIDACINNRKGYFPNSDSEKFFIREFLRKNIGIKNAGIRNNKYLFVDLTPEPSSFPVFEIYLDAEWAGIEKLTTKPRCEFLRDSVEVKTAEKSVVGLKIINDNDNPGSIISSVSCSSGISASITPKEYSFSGKGYKKASLSISGLATSSDVDGKCTVTVTDSNDASLKKKCSINVRVKKIECENIGDSKCSADFKSLLTCGSDNFWHERKCEYACKTISPTKAECVEKPTPECPLTCEKDSDCIGCGEGYVCLNNVCIKESPIVECKNCFEWLFNKFKKNKYCTPKKYLTEWYIKLLPGKIEEHFTQDSMCPIILLFISVITLLLIIILYYLIKLINLKVIK